MLSRQCLVCKNTFFKKVNTSKKEWENRNKYCSRKCCDKNKKGKPAWNKGKPSPWSKNSPNLFKKGHTPWCKGLKGIRTGPLNNNWKGGVTPEHKLIRRSPEYKEWRTKVFERDNYTCVQCKAKCVEGFKVILEADHIKPFAKFPELRFDLDNGRTLCQPCHRKTDTWGVNVKKI